MVFIATEASIGVRPEINCRKAIDSLVEVPSTPGKFGLNKNKYKEGLNLPNLSLLIT